MRCPAASASRDREERWDHAKGGALTTAQCGVPSSGIAAVALRLPGDDGKPKAGVARAVLAAAFALLTLGVSASLADEPYRSGRGPTLPTDKPVAVVGGSASKTATRLDPVSLVSTGPKAELGEYHDTYSFSPDNSTIAFGISAASDGGGGRVGIRLVDSRDLSVTRNVSTGVYAGAVAWLEPERLVAVLGDQFIVGPCPAPPCDLPDDPDYSTVVVVNPETGQELERSRVAHSCDTSQVRGRALLSLAGRELSIVGSDGSVETVRLPRQFVRCGEIATALDDKRAFVVAEGGDVIAEIALASTALAIHELPHGGAAELVALDRRRLLLAQRGRRGRPNGIELFDLETRSRKTIDRLAGEARVGGGTLLAFEGRPFAQGPGIGVRGYGLSGRGRFRVLSKEHIGHIEVAGRFAYARGSSGMAIIDIRKGTVVHRSRSTFHGDLLTEPSGP